MPDCCSHQADDRGGGEHAADCHGVRAALLTPPGRGALSVVGIAGPGAVELVSRLFFPRGPQMLSERPDGAIVFGTWRAEDVGPGEELVVVRRGSDELEVHCHGGLAAAEAVLSSVERLGGLRQGWHAWLLAGGVDEVDVEARAALAVAGGPKAARILSRQLAGGLEAALEGVQSLIREGRRPEAEAAIDRLLRASRVGLRLTRPWRVVVTGVVNAGKSSLVNALAGYARSIVSPEAGTTRDLLEARIVLDGWEVDLIDTAGLRDTDAIGETERAGIGRAVAACAEADLVVRVIDALDARPVMAVPSEEVLVISKADLVADAVAQHGAAVRTSAATGQGIEELAARIVRRLVPEETDDPTLLAGAVPFTPRQVLQIEGLQP